MTDFEPLEFDRTNRVALIALLAAPQIGNNRAIKLVQLFKSPETVLSAPAREIGQALSLRVESAQEIVRGFRNLDQAEQILAKTEQIGARFVTYWDREYPARLRKIPDPPAGCYFLGEQSPLYDYAIAVVGTRTASEHARQLAHRISREIAAAGVTVVSGMALGIDTHAHEGALQAGGRTVAVLGSGIDVVYPRSNEKLYHRIKHQGAIVSEYPPGTDPDVHHFPQRNRIISGLSLGVTVVEAGRKSGALITARLALDQGRELFALPGPAGLLKNAGTNQLIREGTAYLVESSAEIMEHLRSQLAPVRNISATLELPELKGNEKKIYDLLEQGARFVDDVIRQTGINAIETSRSITTMQLKGLIRQVPGARIERT